MGMSTDVHYFRDIENDKKFGSMMVVKEACEKAGVDYPDEVKEYFAPIGVNMLRPLEEIKDAMTEMNIDVERDYKSDHTEGFEIHLSDLPADCKVIRVVNSY